MCILLVMRLLAGLVFFGLLAGTAQAEVPIAPELHPAAKGKRITWVAYRYEVPDTTGQYRFTCLVTAKGKRVCLLHPV